MSTTAHSLQSNTIRLESFSLSCAYMSKFAVSAISLTQVTLFSAWNYAVLNVVSMMVLRCVSWSLAGKQAASNTGANMKQFGVVVVTTRELPRSFVKRKTLSTSTGIVLCLNVSVAIFVRKFYRRTGCGLLYCYVFSTVWTTHGNAILAVPFEALFWTSSIKLGNARLPIACL